MKAYLYLFGKFLNHCSTEEVFFHWFTFVTFSSFLLMCSRICLLIFPISRFEGLTNLRVGLFSKLSLWSLKVMKASFVAVVSMRSSIWNFSVIVALSIFNLLLSDFCRFLLCCYVGAVCTLWLPICRRWWIYRPLQIGGCHL